MDWKLTLADDDVDVAQRRRLPEVVQAGQNQKEATVLGIANEVQNVAQNISKLCT